uniref:CCR4-NOT transcription complex subunit 9 n=1 Tax=Trichuris muris TaxID=70415 RepID=A0A5S6QAP8_TRIMR
MENFISRPLCMFPGVVTLDQVSQWVENLKTEATQEAALMGLTKSRECIPDLGLFLWNTPGTVTLLLMEIVNAYPFINPPTLSAPQSNRVCNALALMQCIAANPLTQTHFIKAKLPFYFFPFLTTVCTAAPFEYLRLTSLGVIGALVKRGEREVILFLLNTEIIPLCLKTMEVGKELSKTVAAFILQKMLLEDAGLSFVCDNYDRFFHVINVLGKVIYMLCSEPSARLLKQVIRCYCRLAEHNNARETLRHCLPLQLRDSFFTSCLSEDRQSQVWLQQLLQKCDGNLM